LNGKLDKLLKEFPYEYFNEVQTAIATAMANQEDELKKCMSVYPGEIPRYMYSDG